MNDESINKFSEYMINMSYHSDIGWSKPVIRPYAPITISPSAQCLHYGQTVFEDMIAFNDKNNFSIFKPYDHLNKFNHSLTRLEMPTIPVEPVINTLIQLLNVDSSININEKNSIYIRPFMYATESKLGVSKSEEYNFNIIVSTIPKQSDQTLPNAISLYVEQELVKSIRGDAGYTQFGGSFASQFLAQKQAQEKGYDNVLWLEGIEKKYIEEVSNKNIFFVINNEIVTPKLNGSIKPGIMCQTMIELANNLGYQVSEKEIAIEDIVLANDKGILTEVFCTDTLKAITPVNRISHLNNEIILNSNQSSRITQQLYKAYKDIQTGKAEDIFNWTLDVKQLNEVEA